MYKQLIASQVRHGLAKEAATLNLEPKEITERFDIIFEQFEDDLDVFQAAVIEDDAKRQFGFRRYDHNPASGTDILIDENSPDPTNDLRIFMSLFGLKREHFCRVAQEISL